MRVCACVCVCESVGVLTLGVVVLVYDLSATKLTSDELDAGLDMWTRRSLDDGRMILTILGYCIARAVGTIVGMVKITRK